MRVSGEVQLAGAGVGAEVGVESAAEGVGGVVEGAEAGRGATLTERRRPEAHAAAADHAAIVGARQQRAGRRTGSGLGPASAEVRRRVTSGVRTVLRRPSERVARAQLPSVRRVGGYALNPKP